MIRSGKRRGDSLLRVRRFKLTRGRVARPRSQPVSNLRAMLAKLSV